MKHLRPLIVFVFSFAACTSNAPPAPPPPPPAAKTAQTAIADAIAAPGRPGADRKLDAGRHPAEVLEFFGIAPGQHVGEIFSVTGYTTELLARTVGPTGAVISENPPILPPDAKGAWAMRFGGFPNVTPCDCAFADPFPPGTHDLDAVVIILSYHDLVGANVDRAHMNAVVFDSLRHGGVYGVVDHASRAGAGAADAMTLHRVDEALVREEVTKAGFRLAGTANFLRNPADAHDWNSSGRASGDRRGTSDRFVLRFEKP